jgi:hypothetical protein
MNPIPQNILSDYWVMFVKIYDSVKENLFHGSTGWYFEMNGLTKIPHFDSLAAFWPSLQVLVGDISRAGLTLETSECFLLETIG